MGQASDASSAVTSASSPRPAGARPQWRQSNTPLKRGQACGPGEQTSVSVSPSSSPLSLFAPADLWREHRPALSQQTRHFHSKTGPRCVPAPGHLPVQRDCGSTGARVPGRVLGAGQETCGKQRPWPGQPRMACWLCSEVSVLRISVLTLCPVRITLLTNSM